MLNKEGFNCGDEAKTVWSSLLLNIGTKQPGVEAETKGHTTSTRTSLKRISN